MNYNLPDINWPKFNMTLSKQFKKIFEEAGEASEAAINNDSIETIKELLDTIQACDTAIAIILHNDK